MYLEGLVDTGCSLLSIITYTPLVGALVLFFLPSNERLARNFSIFVSLIAFALSLKLLSGFDSTSSQMQAAEVKNWLVDFGIRYVMAVDGISIWMIVLTTFLMPLVLIASTSVKKHLKAYLGCLLLLETGVLGAFFALDAVTFYIFWELMLIPMYFLIGIWGGKRRLYASIKFVLYTALGSLLMLVAIVYLGYLHQEQYGVFSFLLSDWVNLRIAEEEQIWLFAAFSLAFAIKVPIFPLHTWLPDAHVEAPTGGSVILAGVLLKLGIYGLIRFCIPLFPEVVIMASPLFALLGVVGIVFGALVAWVQTDIKKLVAYSSVSHLGFCVLGFAAMNLYGFKGCILQMVSHGISTGALFFLVGVLYDRKHTREIADYGGLAQKVPVFSAVFLIFTLSSIGLPLTNGFVGEFLILLGSYEYNPWFAAVAVSGVILGAMYMLSLYRRVVFGDFSEEKNGDLEDLNSREKLVFAPLLVLVFVIGLYPQPILDSIDVSSKASLSILDAVEESDNG